MKPSGLLCVKESISRSYGVGGNWIDGLSQYAVLGRKKWERMWNQDRMLSSIINTPAHGAHALYARDSELHIWKRLAAGHSNFFKEFGALVSYCSPCVRSQIFCCFEDCQVSVSTRSEVKWCYQNCDTWLSIVWARIKGDELSGRA